MRDWCVEGYDEACVEAEPMDVDDGAQEPSLYYGSVDEFVRESQQPAAAPAAPAPATAPDPIEHLRRLAALRDQGVLTEEEFQAQKARLLADM